MPIGNGNRNGNGNGNGNNRRNAPPPGMPPGMMPAGLCEWTKELATAVSAWHGAENGVARRMGMRR